MCLIAFALNVHEDYPFILIANRDEFYERPTKSAHHWENADIIGGRDMKALGTWMGITPDGKFSAVTNYRDLSNINPEAKSRGDLTTDFLNGDLDPQVYLNKIRSNGQKYNGFNLLVSDLNSMLHFSNYEHHINEFDQGIHGLSNAVMNTNWPKVDKIKGRFEKTLAGNFKTEDFFDLLGDKTLAADDALPNTGISPEWEKALSSICIRTENYGTCSSAVVLKDRNNNVTFVERTFPVGNRREGMKEFRFKIQ